MIFYKNKNLWWYITQDIKVGIIIVIPLTIAKFVGGLDNRTIFFIMLAYAFGVALYRTGVIK